jgi:hypothetical protein
MSDVIHARQIFLEDEKGNIRATLTVTGDGPVLDLLGENGMVRATLGLLKDGPGLHLNDETGLPSVGLAVDKEGPRFWLRVRGDKVVWSTSP